MSLVEASYDVRLNIRHFVPIPCNRLIPFRELIIIYYIVGFENDKYKLKLTPICQNGFLKKKKNENTLHIQ